VSTADEFTKLRPLLSAIAYRITGDARAAQYAVQAAWLRSMAAPTRPASVEGYLAAEVSRIAVRAVRAARVARGDAVGPLLADCRPADPDRPVELADSLALSALMVLERLSPLERAVFVLREAFGCGDEQIAAALGCSEEACRQLLDAVAEVSDGGREPLPWPTCVEGAENVSRMLAGIVAPLARVGITLDETLVGDRPGWVFRDRGGAVLHALVLDVHDGLPHRLHLVTHPGGHADPVAEACAILRAADRAR